MKENLLFGIAGVDGAGKTTLANNVKDSLHDLGREVYISKAHTTENRKMFEELIKKSDDIEMMFIFQLMQRQQYNTVIGKLASGAVVLADRWGESFEAYHSIHGVLSYDEELRRGINRITFNGLEPNKTLYLRLDPEIAMARSAVRGADFFDTKSHEYHKSIAQSLDAQATNKGWHILDGTKSEEKLCEEAISIISPLIYLSDDHESSE